jgi:hypothetical protein
MGVIAAAALPLHFLNTQIHSTNPTLHGVNAVVWTEVQLQYSIITCVCYCLKPFMSAVSTSYGSAAMSKYTIPSTVAAQTATGVGSQ